jgi:hypothetical protein
VDPTGKAFGLDMTDEMLALAEENKLKSGITSVELLKGERFFHSVGPVFALVAQVLALDSVQGQSFLPQAPTIAAVSSSTL